MKKKLIIILILLNFSTQAQTIKGTLTQQTGQQVSLTGFSNYTTQELGKTVIDSLGFFTLNYPKDYKGMALLKTQDNSQLPLVLTEPIITLKGLSLAQTENLQFINSQKNKEFNTIVQGITQYNQAYQAWRYLQTIYTNPKYIQPPTKVLQSITQELQRIQETNQQTINALPKTSYARWFLPIRQLVNEMPNSANVYKERIPQNIQQFRKVNFSNPNFKTSGLLAQVLEGHFMLIEKIDQPKDSMHLQMQTSIKYLLNNLEGNDALLNKIGTHLFNYFEARSLFTASEYLSLQLLENSQCTLEDSLIAKLEGYRKLKAGNTAPDIQLTATKKLSDIKTNKLLVFGASWCPHCKTDTAEILKLYPTWQTKNTEVIYISIDTDKEGFNSYYADKPWQTYCDFKGYETQAAKDYYITGTPSYFLLDANNTILIRPNTVLHASIWIETKLR
ncbi:redoxin domain-containing protein [Polaribacter sp. MSW13]|uniref:Redoxin domain-containing protein n=1 Tax=Polaribacter marinus TaxID=2916838 RepID=A0A9X1VLJ8_9FLAO|nr:thioredoxin-like domain-containing protein [Polaribacter marinus]MCI2228275.1 redoxin domain-containing protein [Polaribacter marinus]